MLGLAAIYFVWRYFFELAHEYGKSPWPISILGVVTYYVSLLVGAFFLGMIFELVSPGYVEQLPEIVTSLMGIAIGILAVFIFYKMLESNWKRKRDKESQTDSPFV